MRTDSIDPLEELLRGTAGESAAPPVAGDFAARVRRTAHRRARRRAAGVAAVSAGVLLAVLLVVSRSHAPTDIARHMKPLIPLDPNTEPIDPQQVRLELASLDAKAAEFRRVADELTRARAADERARRTAELLAQPNALERIEAARQRTALILVREAENAVGNQAQADESYRRAARLFPDTPAGRLAAERLKATGGPT